MSSAQNYAYVQEQSRKTEPGWQSSHSETLVQAREPWGPDPRGVNTIAPASTAFICEKQHTACALRFLNKMTVHFIIPRNVKNRHFQKSALRHCHFKVPGPASSSSLVNHEYGSQPLWRCLRSCWWRSKSRPPWVLPWRNPLLLWLPVSLSRVLQRVKRGVSMWCGHPGQWATTFSRDLWKRSHPW